MTKEQEKAIEICKNINAGMIYFANDKECEEFPKAIETVLSMLKEKDKEIEKLEKENDLAKEQLKKQCEIADERNNLLVKVNRLESQINLMAEWIFDKDYRENSLLIHRDDYYSNCIKQVKKHFEKLAKEKGE